MNRFELSDDKKICRVFLNNSEDPMLIDVLDMDEVLKFHWYQSNLGYPQTDVWDPNKQKSIHVRLHRMLLKPPENFVVDHKNRNKLDNRRCNLRICTRQENNFNRGMSSKNTTGVKGVSFHQKSGRYRAYIKKDRKTKYLGSFKTIEEAAYAREQAAFSLFGEYTNRQAA